MELGRECLELWGYKRVDELIWVKTNQLQQLIRTGRTVSGYWTGGGTAMDEISTQSAGSLAQPQQGTLFGGV